MHIITRCNLCSICIHSTKKFKLIPFLCTHVYWYVLSKVHPSGLRCKSYKRSMWRFWCSATLFCAYCDKLVSMQKLEQTYIASQASWSWQCTEYKIDLSIPPRYIDLHLANFHQSICPSIKFQWQSLTTNKSYSILSPSDTVAFKSYKLTIQYKFTFFHTMNLRVLARSLTVKCGYLRSATWNLIYHHPLSKCTFVHPNSTIRFCWQTTILTYQIHT